MSKGWLDQGYVHHVIMEDKNFPGDSPLEVHGRFSEERYSLPPLGLLGPENLMLVACHANIYSFML